MGNQSILYAAFRSQLPAPTVSVVNGGTLTAGSFYLAIVPVNRVGLGKPSPLQLVSWGNNQKIQVTLPARNSGEEFHRIIIAASATNDATQLQPLCWWRGYSLSPIGGGYLEEIQNTLPATVELSSLNHVLLGGVAATPAALTAIADPLDGMCRWLTAQSNLFYYDPQSTAAPGETVIVGNSGGRWLPWIFPETLGVGTVNDPTGEYGALRDARTLTDADVLFPPPAYRMDGSTGPGCTYWIANGTSESGTDIEAGKRVALEIAQNGLPRSQLFDRRVVGRVLGIARISDGTLNTAGITVAEHNHVYAEPLYTLEVNLQPGRALVLQVALRFKQEDLDGYLQSGGVQIKPYFPPQSGSYIPGYRLWGDLIYALGNRLRVFPRPGAGVRVGDGAGMVKRFEFELKPVEDLSLPGNGLSDFKITVNKEGDLFLRGNDPLEPTELTRAIVTMGTGRSNPSTVSAYVPAGANSALTVTVTYPNAIRSDLGDVLAGATTAAGLAQLNAPFCVLYLQRQSDGQIREFINNAVLPGATQEFTIEDFSLGTVIGAIPAAVAENFGLWASDPAPAVAVAVTSGSLAADSYRCRWALRYTGSTATAISHRPVDGCIPEMNYTIGEVFGTVATLQETVAELQSDFVTVQTQSAGYQTQIEALQALIDDLQTQIDELVASGGGGSGTTFTFASFGDQNGLFYYIGTNGGTQAWVNPSEYDSPVAVTWSQLVDGTRWYITDRNSAQYAAGFGSGNTVTIDLGASRAFKPTYYTLRHINSGDYILRNWKLRGSNDNSTWTDLDVRTNDTTMSGALSWGGFTVTAAPAAYRYLQIQLTGPESSGTNYLYLNEIEFYGVLNP